MTLLAAAASTKPLWYATRGTGVVALLLLTAIVVIGILGSIGWRTERLPRVLVGGLHRNLSLFAIVFIAAHVVTAVADRFAPIGLKDGVLPFLSPYRPVWLGLGTVAFDLLLALVLTSLVRVRLGVRVWRGIHWLAYVSWPIALLHAFGTGSDARVTWMASIGFASAAVVTLAVVVRVAQTAQPVRGRMAAAGLVVAAPLAMFAWYQGGPARRGWAARAGTPASLLARTHAGAARSTLIATRSLPPKPFDARLSGRLRETGPDGNGLVRINILAAMRGGVAGRLRITLWGEPSEDGGVALASSDVALAADGTTSAYVGRVVGLAGNRVDAALADGSGRRLRLSVDLRLDRSTGAVAGNLHGNPT